MVASQPTNTCNIQHNACCTLNALIATAHNYASARVFTRDWAHGATGEQRP